MITHAVISCPLFPTQVWATQENILDGPSGSILEANSWLENLGELGLRLEPPAWLELYESVEEIGSFSFVKLKDYLLHN
jgi:hypothetical protein